MNTDTNEENNNYTNFYNIILKKEYHDNGIISEEYYLTNNVKNGEYKSYNYDGTLNITSNYVDGKLHGKCKKYDKTKDNRLHIECNYIDDKLEGEFIIYWHFRDNNYISNVIIKEIYNYNNGKKNGEYKKFYNNSELEKICRYIDDKKQGECKEYHQTGELWKTYNYVDDLLDGEYKEYNYSGVINYHYYKAGFLQDDNLTHLWNVAIDVYDKLYNNIFL
jgi:antitoxin component YwqK of YwqJK toxin-antitoxin module